MTFADLKQAVLNNAKPLEVCDSYQDALISSNYAGLIDAGLKSNIWAYQSGVITDALLAEIPEANLNAKGIYSTGSFTLTNPSFDEIIVLKNAVVDLTISGNNKLSVIVMGSAQVFADVSGNGHLILKGLNYSLFSLILGSNAIACVDVSDTTATGAQIVNDSVLHLVSRGNAVVNLVANNSSFVKLTSYAHSQISYGLNDTAQVVKNAYNSSTIISPV